MTGSSPRDLIRARLADLPPLIKAQRKVRGLAFRPAALEIGVPLNTLVRAEHGHMPDGFNLLLILQWLDVPPAWFVGERAESPMAMYGKGWDDCAAAMRAATERDT